MLWIDDVKIELLDHSKKKTTKQNTAAFDEKSMLSSVQFTAMH